TNFPSLTHCWKRLWQVWYGGYLAGISAHCAPLPRIQSTPLSTVPVSCQGRPRLSLRRTGRKTGSTNSHCSSVSSQRPAIAVRRDALSNSSFAEFRRRNVYEMGSRISCLSAFQYSMRRNRTGVSLCLRKEGTEMIWSLSTLCDPTHIERSSNVEHF